MIIQSEKRVYNESGKAMPICEFDTDKLLVKSYDNEKMVKTLLEHYDGDINELNLHDKWCEYEFFFSTEAIRYHVNYVMAHNPNKFTELVNENAIFQYLWDLDWKIFNEIQAQVEHWKEHAEDYQVAMRTGDIITAAKIEKMLELQAKEVIYPLLGI